MSQRKLNRRQQTQAKQRHQQKKLRSTEQNRDLTRQSLSGNLSSEQRGLVIARFSREFDVEALEGEDKGTIHRCVSRTNLGAIVPGDIVIWRSGNAHNGVIEACLPRHSLLERPDSFGRVKPIAANIDQILIVVAVQPAPQTNLIDRYLVAAELMRVRPVLVLNKADLIDDDNRKALNDMLAVYHGLNYLNTTIISSRHHPAQLGDLPTLIKDHTSIVTGQSGVGKSSLINALLPDANLNIGELSYSTGEGTHTTTQAKLFHLPNGGQLIDSPGIREFGLWHINPEELQRGFIEINKASHECKFRDCQHLAEKDCAVLNAVQQGTIQAQRFESFLRIRTLIAEQQLKGLTRTQ